MVHDLRPHSTQRCLLPWACFRMLSSGIRLCHMATLFDKENGAGGAGGLFNLLLDNNLVFFSAPLTHNGTCNNPLLPYIPFFTRTWQRAFQQLNGSRAKTVQETRAPQGRHRFFPMTTFGTHTGVDSMFHDTSLVSSWPSCCTNSCIHPIRLFLTAHHHALRITWGNLLYINLIIAITTSQVRSFRCIKGNE